MKKAAPFFFFTVICILFTARSITAEQLTIHFNRHFLQDGKINTHLSLRGKISYDTVDAIRNGITATFFITFQLSDSRGIFGIGKHAFIEKVETFDISYDVWENSFIIEDKSRKNSHNVVNSSDIIQKIDEVINPLVLDLSSMVNSDHFYLRAKIKIKTIKLFPPFGIFLLFFDPWNYESDWINTEIQL